MNCYLSKISNRIKNTSNPHSYLGLQEDNLIIQFSPNRKENTILVRGEEKQMELFDSRGYFLYQSCEPLTIFDYQIIHSDASVGFDPYSVTPSVSLVDIHLFDRGEHYALYNFLGSHVREHDGLIGTSFAVFAPNAQYVHLRCDLGNWREKIYPMRKSSDLGIFELFIPGLIKPIMYKYSITTKQAQEILKSDPFARRYELRPKNASIVHKVKAFPWTDQNFLKARKQQHNSSPMNIYELHLGAWSKTKDFANYREIAVDLVSYVNEMGYTHIELLPITEHPLDESWGYQVVGFFSPTSRYGTEEDFKYFVNYLHNHGIGIILDFVPAHFPEDESFLANFDGNFLFENPHPVMGKHPEWGTLIFNYSSAQVRNFLISAALFWIEQMHIDGLRIDAVGSILYLDYYRQEGGYEQNHLGGVENFEGIAFLKELNSVIKQKHPDVYIIAEDSSLYPAVTKDSLWGGLNFCMKWNMGWCSDLFKYLSYTKEEKILKHGELLNSYKEVFREKYLLAISHDDVSAGKKSLLNKFSEVEEEKFAYLRLIYSVAIAHPGKKLFFMGHEIGENEEFNEKYSFRKLPIVEHAKLKNKKFTRDMNKLYKKEKALYEIDFDPKGFCWIDHSDASNQVICFLRRGIEEKLLIVHNFSKQNLENYFIAIPGVINIEEIINTDQIQYGGSGIINSEIGLEGEKRGIHLNIAKLSTSICRVSLDKNVYI
jgi:1,4-alpha-glucan branching enzyme